MRSSLATTARAGLIAGLLALVGLAAGAGIVAGGHGGNFTVAYDGPPDHEPGEDNASAALLSVNTRDIGYLEEAAIRYPDGVPSKCFRADVRTLGIDRNDDAGGTTVDEPLLQYTSGTQRSTHEVVIEFYDRDNPTGTSTNLAAGDEFILSVGDCLQNPEQAGWYRMETQFTGADVESATQTSHYVWICDCENEQQAREQLGPPPSEPTPTPAATTTSTPTPTPTPTPTTTATPTPSATAAATGPDAAGDDASATPTATEAVTDSGGATTATATPTATTGGGGDGGPSSTASSSDGAGFGPAALLATGAVGGGLLMIRRRRGSP